MRKTISQIREEDRESLFGFAGIAVITALILLQAHAESVFAAWGW